jgi:hypothetical protein
MPRDTKSTDDNYIYILGVVFNKPRSGTYAQGDKQRKDTEMKPSTNGTEGQVRQRAYELWEHHGRSEGHETEFWLQAERELKGERSSSDISKGVSANAASARSGSGSDGPG